MHFCPRPSCRRYYHQKCLVSYSKDIAEHHLRLLASSPDSDEEVVLGDLLARSGPPKKKRRGRPSKSIDKDTITHSIEAALSNLPPDLLLVAQQQIVRGATFGAGGVTGNVSAVVRARKIVYEALEGTSVSERWKENLDVDRAVYTKKAGRVPAFVCPQCKGAI
jgi:hypothetical protein